MTDRKASAQRASTEACQGGQALKSVLVKSVAKSSRHGEEGG